LACKDEALGMHVEHDGEVVVYSLSWKQGSLMSYGKGNVVMIGDVVRHDWSKWFGHVKKGRH